MKFTKLCGAGNDFVLLDARDGGINLQTLPSLAQRLCERHFSVGADGMLVLVPPTQGGDCKILFFNNDGSAAEMCGNGARCVCRYCHDRGISGETQRIETTAGIVVGQRIRENLYRIQLNSPSVIELQKQASAVCDYLELGDPGIPHAVVETDLSGEREKLRGFARSLRHDPAFPRGANVNLCQVIGEDEVRLMTYERGVEDFTLACGTGTGATVAALTLRGRVSGKQTCVHTDGGTLYVNILREPLAIFLTGEAEIVFDGTI